MAAFGIFDLVEIGKKLTTKENLLYDDSVGVGRLQIASITAEAKRDLIQCLQDHFCIESIIELQSVPNPEPHCVSVWNQELPLSIVNESRDEEEQESVSFVI